MIYRIISYIFIMLVYAIFTYNTLHELQVDNYYLVALSTIPSMLIILFSNILRTISGKFSVMLSMTRNLLKAITYIFNVMLFTIWNFLLLYLINLQYDLSLFSLEMVDFFLFRVFYVVLFSILIDLFMIGITVFKNGGTKNGR